MSKAAGAADEKSDDRTPKIQLHKSGRLKLGTTLKKSPFNDDMTKVPDHTWSELPAETFKVRKKGYLGKESTGKARSKPALYEILDVDFIVTKDNKLTHLASYFDGTSLPKLDPVPGKDHKIPGYITFSIIVHNEGSSFFSSATDSGSMHLHCVAKLTDAARKSLASGKPWESLKLWDHHIQNDFKGDKKTGNTLKLISLVANEKAFGCPMLLKPLFGKYNGTPFLVFKAARYYWRNNFIDIEVDSHLFASAAKKGVDNFRGYMKNMVVDIGAVIEGRCDGHLPEQMLASARAYKLDCDKAVLLPKDLIAKIKALPDEVETKSDE